MSEKQLFKKVQELQIKRQEALKLSGANDTPQNPTYLEQARKMKEQADEIMQKLEAKLWPFAKELPQQELKEQYDSQKEIFAQNSLLEALPSGELGITGIDKKHYPFPSFEQIKKELSKNKELKLKMEQGLIEINIAPFALPLSKLTEAISKSILKHKKESKLFATKKDQNDPNEQLVPLELDEDQPLWVWDGYQNADIENKIVYFPKQYDKDNHQGKTKREVLQIQTKFPGYLITLQETNINIPRENQGKTIKQRKQLETNQTPIEYLKKLQTDKQYEKESGTTPEEWLVKFLNNLEKTNQAMDDYQGNGSVNYNLAGYFPASGFVSYAYWYRDFRRAALHRVDARIQNAANGARSAVRVGLEI